jgi:hypothetical protein
MFLEYLKSSYKLICGRKSNQKKYDQNYVLILLSISNRFRI